MSDGMVRCRGRVISARVDISSGGALEIACKVRIDQATLTGLGEDQSDPPESVWAHVYLTRKDGSPNTKAVETIEELCPGAKSPDDQAVRLIGQDVALALEEEPGRGWRVRYLDPPNRQGGGKAKADPAQVAEMWARAMGRAVQGSPARRMEDDSDVPF